MGPLIIISGPSGSGKSTLVRRLLATDLPLQLSVSATTREPRPNETHGVDYFFWTKQQFRTAIAENNFLEYAEVFGNLYGTPRQSVNELRKKGIGVILEIDVQGARQVRKECPDVVSIFLKAPNVEEYENRLRSRKTESEEKIQRRLREAAQEEAEAKYYTHVIINDLLDRAFEELQSIIVKLLPGENYA